MDGIIGYERWTSDTGQKLLVHTLLDCDAPCPVHSPSQHPLVGARRHWRVDRGFMERICEHGVGHPDPDDIAVGRNPVRYGTHGCDGCCRKEAHEPGGEPTEVSHPA